MQLLDSDWYEDYACGDAGEFHRREVPADLGPSVWWFEVDHAALVLGSSQPIGHVDLGACHRAAIDVVRRRSGGGAVLLQPGDVTWVDVVIPTRHHHWTADVSTSALWLGGVWQRTLEELGVQDITVHRGPMISTRWSRHVCFAGVGGGEVIAGVSKLVGISQRRTRFGARFQCALYHRWRPGAHAELFAKPGPSARDLLDAAASVDVPFDDLRRTFMATLRRSTPSLS